MGNFIVKSDEEFLNHYDCEDEELSERNKLYSELKDNNWSYATSSDDRFFEYGFYNKDNNVFVAYTGNLHKDIFYIYFKTDKENGGILVEPADVTKISKIFAMDYNFNLKFAIQADVTTELIPKYGMGDWCPSHEAEFNAIVKERFEKRKKKIL